MGGGEPPPARREEHREDIAMHFTLDGQSFELTPELVRRSLVGQDPEDIREYWVEIDGVRWPVKQVIALATGAKRTRFQSQDSRRWLRNLGFAIGPEASATADSSAPTRGSAARQRFDPTSLAVLESLNLQ